MDIAEFADLFTDRMSAHLDRIERDLASAPVVTPLTDIPDHALAWLWPGWIPSGTLTILGGHVGDGKSTVASALVAALTRGAELPDGTNTDPANVLILAAEDDPARVIRPRLEANAADPDHVFLLSPVILQQDAGHLRRIIETNRIDLLLIDPLSCLLPRAERGGESEIRAALQPLIDIATDTGVALLATMRVGKTGLARRPAQRLVGSSAVPAIARSVIMVARDEAAAGEGEEQEPGRAILQVVKSNYATAPAPVALRMDPGGRVHWLGPADTGIDDLADDRMDRRLSRTERQDAADFLREYLRGRDVEAAQVLKQAKDLGFSEITIRRAKKDTGITSYRKGSPSWMWHLPDGKEDDHLLRET